MNGKQSVTLNMKGAADFSSSAEINLEVIKAGNDILLMPSDIEGTFRKVQEAYEQLQKERGF